MSSKSERVKQGDFFNTCSTCGTGFSCCFGTRPPLTRERRRIIKRYLKEHGIMIGNPFATDVDKYVYPKEKADGFCIFHDCGSKRCLIHTVKPETCVAGPITFDINRKQGKIEWFIKMETICPLAGIIRSNEKLLQDHLSAARQQIMRLVNKLETEELDAILLKEEPETIKIGEEDIGTNILERHNRTWRAGLKGHS